MTKRMFVSLAIGCALTAGISYAQFPIMDMIAGKVIQKYQSSTCEQLWQTKGQHGPEEQRLMSLLKSDPQMRQQFIDKIAGPVINKMFECGMIP